MKTEVSKHLDCLKSIKESMQLLESTSGVMKEKLSEAQVLLTRVPVELQNRYDYLQTNMNHRLEYEHLLEKFFEWTRQSENIVELSEEGYDFDRINAELEDLNVSILRRARNGVIPGLMYMNFQIVGVLQQ